MASSCFVRSSSVAFAAESSICPGVSPLATGGGAGTFFFPPAKASVRPTATATAAAAPPAMIHCRRFLCGLDFVLVLVLVRRSGGEEGAAAAGRGS